MRYLFVIIALLFSVCRVAGAADGISNGLMNVPSAATLPPGTFEISPTFQFGWVGQDFGAQVGGPGVARTIPFYDSQSNLRITTGLFSSWEVGMQVPLILRWEGNQSSALVERLGLATKVNLFQNRAETFRLSVFAGAQVPLMAKTWVLDVGPVFDFHPTKWLFFHLSAGGSIDTLLTTVPGFRYDLGIGVYFWPEKLQLVVEWSHIWAFGAPVTTKGILSAAVNWYVNPVVTVLVGGLFDLFGANQPHNIQAAVSLTFAIDLREKPQKILQ